MGSNAFFVIEYLVMGRPRTGKEKVTKEAMKLADMLLADYETKRTTIWKKETLIFDYLGVSYSYGYAIIKRLVQLFPTFRDVRGYVVLAPQTPSAGEQRTARDVPAPQRQGPPE